MAVKISAVYHGDLACQATHGPSGKVVLTDAPVDNGGKGASFSPTDLVATALATCVMTICGLVAARHEIDLRGMVVEVEKEMITAPIRRIGSLRTIVTLPPGLTIEPEMRERLIAAARKCPVHQSLHTDIDAPIDFA